MPTSTCSPLRTKITPSQSPGLIAAGYIDRLLLSQDVFLKMMPSHYGGSAIAFVLSTSYFG